MELLSMARAASPLPRAYAERLRQAREYRGMTQRQLAKAIGVAMQMIQNYEHARAGISAAQLEQLAWALQCEPADLLAPPGSPLPRSRQRYRVSRPQTARQLVFDFDDGRK